MLNVARTVQENECYNFSSDLRSALSIDCVGETTCCCFFINVHSRLA